MPLPPQLTPEQRADALKKAAEARKQRAEIKEKLKLGTVTLSELLEKAPNDELIGKMKVASVLESLPGIGKVRSKKIMDAVGITETRRLQGLGVKQKQNLLEEASKA
ncbi:MULTISPECIES: integration host factor, actinobacterial type [Acidithrix]|uniref:Integration host factor-like helix-two turn-helix domain-containing protein n=1 Tax=Acidithrix ferrooxidans TaxID=1280514 RepID=A0A0D8HFY0_9ACTN|nr:MULTISPECIES: integration host factor, actinobacterial type [Acidithrix]KJF16799.1 hypothetical protein AXFE_23780 [Acidithrix ferrooxidans]CAG4931121.1 unnamed protein product [Acidithrix sp. C25]